MQTLKSLAFCLDLVTENCHRTKDIRIKFQCLNVNLEGVLVTSSVNNLITSRGTVNFSHEV